MDYYSKKVAQLHPDKIASAVNPLEHPAEYLAFMQHLFDSSEFGKHMERHLNGQWPLQQIHQVDLAAGILLQSTRAALDRMDWEHANDLLACVILFLVGDFLEFRDVDKNHKDYKRVWQSIDSAKDALLQEWAQDQEFI